MKIITKQEAVWFPWEGNTEIEIRSFPYSQLLAGEGFVEGLWSQFNYCVMNWKGFVDEEGKEYSCNEETKRYLFDYSKKLQGFVYVKAKELNDKVLSELKN